MFLFLFSSFLNCEVDEEGGRMGDAHLQHLVDVGSLQLAVTGQQSCFPAGLSPSAHSSAPQPLAGAGTQESFPDTCPGFIIGIIRRFFFFKESLSYFIVSNKLLNNEEKNTHLNYSNSSARFSHEGVIRTKNCFRHLAVEN